MCYFYGSWLENLPTEKVLIHESFASRGRRVEDYAINDEVLRGIKKKRIWQRADRIAETLGVREEWEYKFRVVTFDVAVRVGGVNIKIHKSVYGESTECISIATNGVFVFRAVNVTAFVVGLFRGEKRRIFLLSKKAVRKYALTCMLPENGNV